METYHWLAELGISEFAKAERWHLVQTLLKETFPTPTLDGMLADDELLSTFDVGQIAPEALLVQTG